MIKGVNKRIVEITSTEHEYFEKAVLYVKADKSALPAEKITEEAREYLGRIVPVKRTCISSGNKLLIGLLAVLIGLAVLLVMLL
ncbi:MAG: hypothetical protein IKK42_01915 [Oscillospiraceae bacterium]|nr:hypothetical protein [Oscillospiraceae bacterium]